MEESTARRSRSHSGGPCCFRFGWGLGPEALVINGLWLVALILPLAYWAALSRRSSAIIWVGILLPLALGVIPAVFGLHVGHWSEWLTSGIAILLGIMAATRARVALSESR